VRQQPGASCAYARSVCWSKVRTAEGKRPTRPSWCRSSRLKATPRFRSGSSSTLVSLRSVVMTAPLVLEVAYRAGPTGSASLDVTLALEAFAVFADSRGSEVTSAGYRIFQLAPMRYRRLGLTIGRSHALQS
jgi:hypothetical protein